MQTKWLAAQSIEQWLRGGGIGAEPLESLGSEKDEQEVQIANDVEWGTFV